MLVPLGRWRPDRVPYELEPGDMTVCKNVLPYDNKYMPAFNVMNYSSDTLPTAGLNGAEFRSTDGSFYGFIGIAAKLYRLNPAKTLTDVTRASGGDYSTGDNPWCFEQYGDWYIGTNYADVPQVLKGATTANFVALGGSPPKAKYALLYKGHLILAFLNESSTIGPKKIRWSRLEDVEDWTETGQDGPDSNTLSDANGDITGLARVGDNFAIFHENSITLGYFADYSPSAFGFNVNIVNGIGCLANGSIISVGGVCYFMSRDNIYKFDGTGVTPLGNDLVESVMAGINTAYFNRITSTIDPKNGIIFWAYPSTNSSGNPDRLLAYNYRQDKFAIIEITVESLMAFHSGAMTFENSPWQTIEEMPYQLDSNYYAANTPQVGVINTSHRVCTLTGTVLAGTIETGEMSKEGRMTMVTKVRPRIQLAPASSVSVRAGSRRNEADGVTYSSAATVQTNGYAYLRAHGRHHRLELTTGQHSGLTGIEVDFVEAGEQ